MKKENRKNKRNFRLSDQEKIMFDELKIKYGYRKTQPLIEIMFNLFNTIELQEAEIFKLKTDRNTITEIENENKIINIKLNLILKILKEEFHKTDDDIEKMQIDLMRKNMNK